MKLLSTVCLRVFPVTVTLQSKGGYTVVRRHDPTAHVSSSLNSYARLRKWIKLWSIRVHDELDIKNDDYNLVIDILFHVFEDDPKKTVTGEQCLQKVFDNGLFWRNWDGYIILATDTEVNTLAEAA